MENGRVYRGSCHCGAVAFEVTGRLEMIDECNCSICTKKGYLHWIVPRASFRLLTSQEDMATYSFNTGVARHYFCQRCGIAPFYVPRSDPDKIDVNVRCLEGIEPGAIALRKFDGRNWEAAFRAQRGIEPSRLPHGGGKD